MHSKQDYSFQDTLNKFTDYSWQLQFKLWKKSSWGSFLSATNFNSCEKHSCSYLWMLVGTTISVFGEHLRLVLNSDSQTPILFLKRVFFFFFFIAVQWGARMLLSFELAAQAHHLNLLISEPHVATQTVLVARAVRW